MHILILGAGAMGSLLGARLSGTSATVSLLSTNREHIRAVSGDGLVIEELDGSIVPYRLSAFHSPRDVPGTADLVIVMVKSYATRDAVGSITDCCGASTVFLTLQNGIGNWENIAAVVDRKKVLVGSTAQGSTLVRPGRIRHGGNGATFIGEIGVPASERVREIVELFRSAGLVTEPSDHVERLIWEKLMVNAGINAITALTGIRNGVIADFASASSICRAAVEEALPVARAKGFEMGPETVDRVLSVARATAINRSSMGQDVDRKKRTEIDAINGAIVAFGEQCGIPTPVNRTLTGLVKTLEASYLGKS
ncbi:ketopantoate reductase family protein [Syntrophobacter fumaroxidans]|uniref:2-dehydropantoate 2-reductase n=1 Tax=Syntrophobacter fumaroxidans (strain DSM 10017 / MPOB) TaxID=335543 RepID=A0LLX9_SYNFM|nr:ketopantoate reductase family protein [Syntrophobacter fumaroxidans]ABK18431.1 2-dehydropantoate 2-reductase [Syntrophobacter fumaroxidans MPOB]